MKIVLVIDQFDDANNGTTISARRFARALAAHGNQVRVIACGHPTDYKYAVRQLKFTPVVDHLISSQGMRFAMPSRHAFEKAAAWADVVHFMMPSPLAIMGLRHVRKLGIPHTAAFHCQPENITYTLKMGNSKRVNDFVYNRFRDTFFNKFTHIHCPSNMIANQLSDHGYTAKLHVISNGISPNFVYQKRDKEDWMAGKFNIIMVGRYAGEKRQDLLLEACAKAKHADQIQLILAGKGPLEKKYRKMAEKLQNPIVMDFYSQERLIEVLAMSDLYVHTSDAEIEAMSCMEAFASGLVPIIANSERSATPQFALTQRSLFEAGNSDSLAEQIDWWIDHEEERKAMEVHYAEHAKQYTLEESIRHTEEMFQTAIREHTGKALPTGNYSEE
ncbi:glycosyltransferase [Bengtsoniella intestinalis]|uniref:glycosyltransferase n=1 Tax=Bengtsoniella intestinalis TaxID=3073143 RepID=UPI00391FB1FE